MEIDYIKKGDCLELMKSLPDNSIDLILTDLPYGTTGCKWDTIIPLKPLWRQYNRIIKNNGAILLFCNQPFTSELIKSNIKNFKYTLVWDKEIPGGLVYAKYRPLSQVEDIAVFTKNGEKTKYNPQMIKRDIPIKSGKNHIPEVYGQKTRPKVKREYNYKHPTTLIKFMKVRNNSLHPTEKPVKLLQYLINTYTDKGDIVLDSCMGSGSTCVAAINTGRHYIGYEIEDRYFKVAYDRINDTKAQIQMFV